MIIAKSRRPRGRRPRDGRPLPGWRQSIPRLEWMEDRTHQSSLQTLVVDNTADSGSGSLRQAIIAADETTGGTVTIDFDIPGSGVQTITPQTALPSITASVFVDGFSQPGYAGTPLIELSGSEATTADGLTITGSGTTIRGLDVGGFYSGAGIHITSTSATGNWIYGNEIGTDPTGSQARSNEDGVQIDGGATDNLIGTNGDGVNDTAESNLLSANLYTGVLITGGGTSGNAVAGNLIGTNASGTVALDNGTQLVAESPNEYLGGGVLIGLGATDNRIGTDGDGVGERNVIAGSVNDGIDIYGIGTEGNIVAGNFIGTDLTGTRALGIAGDGIHIVDGASSNWVGVNPEGGAAYGDEGNLISGVGDGVQLSGALVDGNVVAGNKIGTDVTGLSPIPNAYNGVEIDSGVDNTIGGTTAGRWQRLIGQRL